MATQTSSVGLKPIPVAGATTPVSITAVTTITLPTAIQRIPHSGVMECTVVVEGTVTSRYTFNGVTPTAAIGLLLAAPTATLPVTMQIVGEANIAAFKIIGTAAGNLITYNFFVRDVA